MSFTFDFGSSNVAPVTHMHRGDASTIVSLVRLTFESDDAGTTTGEIDQEYYGTAFCIATLDAYQAIYLTAHHNIVDLIDRENTNVAVMTFSAADPTFFTFVQVRQWAVLDEYTDIAAFCLDFHHTMGPPARIPRPLRLWDFTEPQAGQNCVALGYGSPYPRPPDTVPGLHASRGTIEEVHSDRRDSAIVNYPCVRTNAEMPGGMSGGPVFTEDARVFGVVSRGTAIAEGGVHTSYASLLQAATALDVPVEGPTGTSSVHIGDLVHSGAIDIGGSRAAVRLNSEGMQVSWDSARPVP